MRIDLNRGLFLSDRTPSSSISLDDTGSTVVRELRRAGFSFTINGMRVVPVCEVPKPVQVARSMRSARRLPRASPRACHTSPRACRAAHFRWSGVVAGDEVVAPGLSRLWCRGGDQRASRPQYHTSCVLRGDGARPWAAPREPISQLSNRTDLDQTEQWSDQTKQNAPRVTLDKLSLKIKAS